MYFLKYTEEEYDYILKILIIGKEEIGKTFFRERIKFYGDYKKYNNISKDYKTTIGVDFMVVKKKFNDKIYKFQIWDTAGLERFQTITKTYYKGANIILIFYDALDKSSFEKAKILFKECLNDNKKQIYFLIRSKYELNLSSKNDEIVSDEEALEFADKNNLIFAHISSFENYGNGIDNLFDLILKEIISESEIIKFNSFK